MANFDPEKAKYLYNPVNNRIVINSEMKRRVSPKLIPCNRLDASDVAGDPAVLKAHNLPHEPVSEDEANESTHVVRGGFAALRLQIASSEDKAELRQIGADLAVEPSLTKAMRISTMRNRLSEKIDRLEAAS